MSTQLTSSNDFASLVKKLQQSPGDAHLKQMVVKHLPQMRKLAESNPLALYHLAHIYPPTSSQYKQTILRSADLGCTNAMLEACHLLVKSKHPEDLEKATGYMKMIKKSKDSFIIKHTKPLLAAYPQLNKTEKQQNVGHHTNRFFTTPSKRTTPQVAVEQKSTIQP